MIFWAHPSDGGVYDALAGFISERVWGEPQGLTDGTIMAVADGDVVVGACIFHNWQPDAGVIELTGAGSRWFGRSMLHAIFSYAFGQMECQAVVMRVDPENTSMCRIASAFGFQRYDIPRLRGRNKAEALFILGDDEWRGGRFYKEA